LPATVSADQQAMIECKSDHFERDVILWAVRWYVGYPISCRQLEEMMEEHSVEVDHATLNRWVLKSGTQVADVRRIVPGTAILFVTRINPDVLRDLVYPAGKFATEAIFSVRILRPALRLCVESPERNTVTDLSFRS
jgi:hypothetical protein